VNVSALTTVDTPPKNSESRVLSIDPEPGRAIGGARSVAA
jgi:hypothetical protein